MVQLKEKEIVITIRTEEPAQKLAELQGGLLYVLNDFFGHLDNVVDVESGAAYNDLIVLLRAMLPDAGQMEGMGAMEVREVRELGGSA
jgi:hypothetical protein